MYIGATLAKFQCLKIQDFGIPLFTQKFFYLPTISQEQLTIPFSAITQYYLLCVLKYIPQSATNVLLLSAENTKKQLNLTFQRPQLRK